MSSLVQVCIYCSKECKSSDSKPYPNSRSKDRIHNRCQIKKTLVSKQKVSNTLDQIGPGETSGNALSKSDLSTPVASLVDKLITENQKRQDTLRSEKINKIISEKEAQAKKDHSSEGFFFDVKAGIAKPHEKRQYLHHRKISEIALRYDDHGYVEETVGRSYDHSGKDLNTLSEESDDDTYKPAKLDSCFEKEVSGKRKAVTASDVRKVDAKRRGTGVKVDETNPCWFCLSSAHVEDYLIIAIGSHCYLTLAKGGLVDDHCLVIPKEHIQSVDSSKNSKEILDELEDFKNSLVKLYQSKSMGVIFYERNFRSVHWQLQVVPIKQDRLETLATNIKDISKLHFPKADYTDISNNRTITDYVPANAPYLYWQLEPNGEKFVCQLQVKDAFFPIQLPRMVLSDKRIMNCEDRVEWKKCSKSRDEYIEIVEKFKRDYARFDIT